MPSSNPDLTPIHKLPTPVPADPPDIPGDMKALADKIDPLIPRIYHAKGQSVGITSGKTTAKTTVDISGGGFKTPPFVVAEPKPVTGSVAVYLVNAGPLNSTTAEVEVRRVDGGNGGTCQFELLAISYPPHA